MPQITMIEDAWNGATLLAAGSVVTVSTELADNLVGAGKARDSSGYREARVDQTMTDDIQKAHAAAVVRAAGISLEYGDSLTNPSDTTTRTAAISTTATLSATATSTYRKARVSWLNNGASGTARLYISVNAENDVQGLVACNSTRRRDHEMTIGDCIMLVCDKPITRLNFTSDTSISSNTHRLVITFGE
jgi:hypothetical protein